jgi:hypothetical protein
MHLGEKGQMSQVSSQSQVKSFSEILSEVRERVEIECFEKRERAVAEELCLIIAEVEWLPSEAVARIGGNDLPATYVSEIYRRIDNGRLAAVIFKYSEARYPIKHKKTYLRTALYNEVFEHESGELNDFNASFGGF